MYLAVFNFLPIPITDGGHMVFLTIEKLKGSPVGPRVQTAATLVGLALIGCLFLILTYHDILRLSGLSNCSQGRFLSGLTSTDSLLFIQGSLA